MDSIFPIPSFSYYTKKLYMARWARCTTGYGCFGKYGKY